MLEVRLITLLPKILAATDDHRARPLRLAAGRCLSLVIGRFKNPDAGKDGKFMTGQTQLLFSVLG